MQRTEKKVIMRQISKSQKYSELTSNFFDALVENGRLPKVDKVVKTFAKMMSSHRGEVLCTVTTATALDAGSQKDLKAALHGFAKKGQALNIELKVDPSIMGGMVVYIGDRFVDMSTATKIRKYSALLHEGV